MTRDIAVGGTMLAPFSGGKWVSRPITRSCAARGQRRQRSLRPATLRRYLNKLRAQPAVRRELVQRVRAELVGGAYHTAEKIAALLDSLADDLRM